MSKRIRVLNAFSPFLRLLEAYNWENFHQRSFRQILRSVGYFFSTTVIILLIPAYGAFSFWNTMDNGADLTKIVIALPLLFTGLQFETTYVALILKNRAITKTIRNLQRVIDRREFNSLFPQESKFRRTNRQP